MQVQQLWYDDGNSILYDLTNPEWRAVRVTERGWGVEYAPAVFRRFSNQLPQVHPSEEYPPEIFDAAHGRKTVYYMGFVETM